MLRVGCEQKNLLENTGKRECVLYVKRKILREI